MDIHLVVVGKTPILTPTGRTIGHIVDCGGGGYTGVYLYLVVLGSVVLLKSCYSFRIYTIGIKI